jgi:sugar/nucleoside kinase (ribokinase family)
MAGDKKFDVVGFGDATLDFICFVDNISNFNQSTFISDVKVSIGGCVPVALATVQKLGKKLHLLVYLGMTLEVRIL